MSGSGFLANFLHEWTHRWCFQSLVGSALALLRMRAACREFRDRSAFDDYVRCMTASTILEPVAEGLALFAEFDTYPGRSPWLSQTLGDQSHVIRACVLKLMTSRCFPSRHFCKHCAGTRCFSRAQGGDLRSTSRRFGSVSLRLSLARSLWCQMATACAELNDRDLFLLYLRSYFYDDPGMVLCMFGSYPSEVHASEAIVNHFLLRIRELVYLTAWNK